MIPKIILTRPKLVVDCKCPKCKSLDIFAIPTIERKCKNCGTKFESEVKINIYQSMAKKIEQLLGHNNEIVLVGARDSSDVFNAKDALKPQSQNEDDIYHAMLAIKNTKDNQKCWVTTNIETTYDFEEKVRCKKCGYCYECVECEKCKNHYKPKIVNGRKRYTCPDCKSKLYKATFIKDLKKECPHCKSKNVSHSNFKFNLEVCPLCKAKNNNKPRKLPVYKLTIQRQKRNWDNAEGY